VFVGIASTSKFRIISEGTVFSVIKYSANMVLRCPQYEIVQFCKSSSTGTAAIKQANQTSFLFSHKLTGISYCKKALYPAGIEGDAGHYLSKLCVYL